VVFSAKTPAPFAGKYTMAIPGTDDPAMGPTGDGFATLTVAAAGTVTIAGTLGDGSIFTAGSTVSKDGDIPLYVSLYTKKGSIFGTLLFLDSTTIEGPLHWTKPANSKDKILPGGFLVDTYALGSAYTASSPVLAFTDGVVGFSFGNLAEDFSNNVSLGANNKVTNSSPNALTLTLTPTTGLFSGTVVPPGATKSIPFKGAIVQGQAKGYGFFLGTNQAGRVTFSAP
jgi:hypothetical protein